MNGTGRPGSRPVGMSRRQALKGAIALVGGSVSAGQLASLAHAMATDEDYKRRFLDREQYATLVRIADLMIPDTDTPGAVEARVPEFVDRMLADFAADGSRATFMQALQQIDDAAQGQHGQAFVALSESRQFDLLAEVDREAFGESANSGSYRMLKSVILLGYYSSEIGASVELRFNPIPGDSPGCVPLESIGRAWYKHWGIA